MPEKLIPCFRREDAGKYFAVPGETVRQALKKLNENGKRVLLIIDQEGHLLGTLSDGDIRTFILSGRSLQTRIQTIFNRSPLFLERRDFTLEKARRLMLEKVVDFLPILDDDGRVEDFIAWSTAFSEQAEPVAKTSVRRLNIPVVIMAGGKGSRLDPFTRVFPKPLLPLGDKPVIQEIIDGFRAGGVDEFVITLNYKGGMVQAFFDNLEHDYHLQFIREKEYLGTAGSLRLIEKLVPETFIVSNCDIIVKANIGDIHDFHRRHKADLTIVSSIQHFRIPYGVIRFRKGGRVTGIEEKPEYTFPINTGVYLLERDVISLIPRKGSFDMPMLIQHLIDQGRRVVMYPVSEGDYIDIGQWDEFKKALVKMGFWSSKEEL